jgi:hypothetical protein
MYLQIFIYVIDPNQKKKNSKKYKTEIVFYSPLLIVAELILAIPPTAMASRVASVWK